MTTLKDKSYLENMIIKELNKVKDSSEEEIDRVTDLIMKKIQEVSFKYAKAEQDEIFDFCFEIINNIFENIGKKYEQNYFIMKSPILDIRILNKLFNELKNGSDFVYKYIIYKDERGLIGLKPTSYQFNKLKLKMIDNILNLEDSEEKSEKLQGLMYY